MDRVNKKNIDRQLRKNRIRAKVSGTSVRPRMSIYVSNRHIFAQLIDDSAQKTLLAVSTVGRKTNGTLTDQATWVGEQIAKGATKAKIKTIVLDRNGKKYHGRIKALAEAARNNGLEF